MNAISGIALMQDTPPIFVNGRFLAQPMTGVQRVAHELTSALSQRYGARLTVLGPARGMADAAAATAVGSRTGQLWEQLDLPRNARNGILVNLGNTAPLAHRRQLVMIHDAGIFSTPEAYSRKFRTWYKLLQGLLGRSGAQIVTVSEFSKRELVRNLGLKPARVHVVHPAADHMARLPADDDILAKHDLSRGGYVLVVGTLAAHKNLAALDELAKALAARGTPLVITGAMGGAAFSASKPASLPAPAQYLGRVSDAQLKALYQNAACFIMPSLYEGFGLPAVEAMVCGCPAICGDIPALRETCGDAALFCDPRAPKTIANVTLALLDDATLRENMRIAALRHSATMTWQRAAETLAGVIAGM
jgi:glycosyltransferase involved in cell wall biosynthesis